MLKNKILATTLTTVLAASALATATVSANAADATPSFPFTEATYKTSPIFPGQNVQIGIKLSDGSY